MDHVELSILIKKALKGEKEDIQNSNDLEDFLDYTLADKYGGNIAGMIGDCLNCLEDNLVIAKGELTGAFYIACEVDKGEYLFKKVLECER